MGIEGIKKRLEGYLYLHKDLPQPNYVPNDDIISLLSLLEQADKAIEEFTDKHFHSGSKSNRTDYVAFAIPTADIFKLWEALQAIRGDNQ